MKYFLIALSVMLGTVVSAIAEEEKDTRTPIERLEGDASAYLVMCRLRVELMLTTGSDAKDADKCLVEGQSKTKKNVSVVMKQVKKPAAAKQLKVWYAAYLTALKGVFPSGDEIKLTYQARMSAQQSRADNEWNLFKAELEL